MIRIPSSSVLCAMALAFFGFTLWTITDAIVHNLGAYPPVQLAFIAGVYSVGLLVAFSPFLGGLRQTLRSPRLGLQIVRGAIIGLSSLASFYAFMYLQLPTAYAIIFLTPVVAKMMAMALNKERVQPIVWLISLLGFVGVLIVVRPGIETIGIGEIAALSIPVCFALAYVMGRTIGAHNQTLLSYSIFGDITMIVMFCVPTYLNFVPMVPVDFFLIVIVAVMGTVGCLLVSVGYAKAPSAYVAPVHYTQIVFGALWGALFFAEYPDMWTVVGASVIIASGLALVWFSRNIEE